MKHNLRQMYESTAEDMLFGIGLLQLPDCPPSPCIHIHFSTWSREKLELIRESFHAGISVTCTQAADGTHSIRLATCERIEVQCRSHGETSVLRGPAWDAELDGIEHRAFQQFERARLTCGGFLLLMQTPDWEFVTGVREAKRHAIVGEITPRRMPMPGNAPGGPGH